MRIFILFLICILIQNTFAAGPDPSIPTNAPPTIPSAHRVNWENAGSINGVYLTQYDKIINVLDHGAVPNGGDDTEEIQSAIDSRDTNEFTAIYFPAGTYHISSTLTLAKNGIGNVVLKGAGEETHLIATQFLSENDHIISIIGPGGVGSWLQIQSYSSRKGTKNLPVNTSSINSGDYIEIKDRLLGWDFVGQIVKVASASYNNIILNDELAGNYNNNPVFRKLNLIKKVGIENLKITRTRKTNLNGNNIVGEGRNIIFSYAAYCWIVGIHSYQTDKWHIHIAKSTEIEVRGSYIESTNSLSPSNGYGIVIDQHSTNCLIEDNILKSLRYAILLQMSANRNVIGYNYCRDGYNPTLEARKGDIEFHGNYAFSNLIEGNHVDKIWLDDTHGVNGPYNTLFRNKIIEQRIDLDNATYTNVIGNENLVNVGSSGGTWWYKDCYIRTYPLAPNDYTVYTEIEHLDWEFLYSSYYPNPTENVLLPDISYYYYVTRPDFLTASYTWPPMGPYFWDKITETFQSTTQNIPARSRYHSGGLNLVYSPPITLPPPTLSVSISGPSVLYCGCGYGAGKNGKSGIPIEGPGHQATGTWTANPVGGNGTYSYQWYTRESSGDWFKWVEATNRSWTKKIMGNTTFKCEVTSDGQTVFATKFVELKVDDLPKSLTVGNYPNPFNPETKINFNLPANSHVNLTVYDINGRTVAVLANVYLMKGKHEYLFNAANLASGIYYYRISTEKITKIKRMSVLK